MSTFAQMRSQIADDLNRTDLTTQINTAINRAINFYQNEEFFFNENTAAFSTIAGQKSYGTIDGIPANLTQIIYMKVTVSGTFYQVRPVTFQYIEKIDPVSFRAYPKVYAPYNQKIYFYPVPDIAYTITLDLNQGTTTLSADSDTNNFLLYAEDLIEAHAKWWIYKKTLKDKNLADMAREDELISLLSLKDQTRQLISAKQIMPSTF